MHIKKYFKEKHINCNIKEYKTQAFTTYKIELQDINDLKKFNNRMIDELCYYLQDESIQVIKGSSLLIITKNKNYGGYYSNFLRYR